MLKRLLSLPIENETNVLFLMERKYKQKFELYWVERLKDYLVEYSYSLAKAFWQKVKETLSVNDKDTPFVYLKDGEVLFSQGKEEDVSFSVNEKEELLFNEQYPVIVDPLYVQEKYHTNQQKTNDEMVTVSPLYIL